MNDTVWLAWIEQLAVAPAGDNRDNELPRSLFHCRLDDQPDHLVPQRLLRPEYWEGLTDRPLFFNSDCFFTSGGESPESTPIDDFAQQGQMVWIRDPGSDALQPFWLGPELAAMLFGAQPGDPAPALTPQARRALIMADVLVPNDYASRRRRQWAEIVSVTGAQFQSEGYAPVGQLIHPFHLAALRRYYRHKLRTGKLHFGDSQSPLRYISHSDPVARFFHQQLTAAITAFAGEPVKPSYVYLGFLSTGSRTGRAHRPRAVRLQRDPVSRLLTRATGRNPVANSSS